MLDDFLAIDRLSQVIEHAIAPAFLLGAVAGFVAIIMTRIENLSRRMESASTERIAGMTRRVFLLHRAAFFGLCAAIAAAALVIISFVLGFLNITHVYGMGLLFLLTFGLLTIALGLFAQEIRTALRDYDRVS
jgi:hypothetical protein